MKRTSKISNRSRPGQFLETLSRYIETCADFSKTGFIVSCDNDDESMIPEVITKAKQMGATVFQGMSANKIDACNRDIKQVEGWDILL
jgi:hypothetical protein